ncbi:MAG: amidohydrolase family protein [Novosphingobium sp.]
MAGNVLIRHADIFGHGPGDVRIADGRIVTIGALNPLPGEPVVDAAGGALLPGLHDHHIHLAGLAVRAASIHCGPPDVTDPETLATRLSAPGSGWLRGIGYHESVMGLPDARALDALQADRPIRIQHRSGRMWLFNTAALDLLLARSSPPKGLEHDGTRYTGRLFDEDGWLQEALGSAPPDLAAVSSTLARHGVTGVTDMSPRNDAVIAAHVADQIASKALRQRCVLAGTQELGEAVCHGWQPGPVKLHLHEAHLPDFSDACRTIAAAHASSRAVAIHCTTEVELVFALAALEDAGILPGDRIEHASIATTEQARQMACLGLSVCVQPHFVFERGDAYLRDVEPRHHPDLYPLARLRDAGLPLCGGSDAPFADADPWLAMRAAATRLTREGQRITPHEALSPEEALALYLADPEDITRQRRVEAGAPADLCLLHRPWSEARERLVSADVRAAFVSGCRIDDGIDQPQR